MTDLTPHSKLSIFLQQESREQLPSGSQFVWKLLPFTPVGRAINSAKYRLAEAGISTADHDAPIILAYVLQRERAWIFVNYNYELDEQQAMLYTELITRRSANEPLNALVNGKIEQRS